MTEESTEVTAQVDTTDTIESRFEVETNIVAEPEKETVAEEVQAEPTPTEESQEKKSINPRTLARKAEKERLIRENATMAEKLRQYEASKQPEAKKERDSSEEPNIQDYDDVLEYTKDMAKYVAAQTFTQETSKLTVEKQIQSFKERAESVRAEKPDFDERLQALNTSGLLTPEVERAVMSSNLSPEVAYHLTQFPDDLMTLRGTPKDMLPKAIKLIEAFIQKGGDVQEKPRVTKAQPPITPPGMSAKTDRSINSYTQEEIENMPLSEYNKLFNIKR